MNVEHTFLYRCEPWEERLLGSPPLDFVILILTVSTTARKSANSTIETGPWTPCDVEVPEQMLWNNSGYFVINIFTLGQYFKETAVWHCTWRCHVCLHANTGHWPRGWALPTWAWLVTLTGYCLHQETGFGCDWVFRNKHLIGTKAIRDAGVISKRGIVCGLRNVERTRRVYWMWFWV